jgi:arylformamidase
VKGKYYDISMEIAPDMAVYKNREELRPKINTYLNHSAKGVQQSAACLDLHTGTHIDMPLHIIANGADSTDFGVDSVCGPCRVIEIPDDIEKITEEVLKTKRIWAGEILLLKTKNSFSDGFSDDFAYLAASGAVYLAGEGARAVGTDGLGIERAQEGHPTHKILLGHGIPVIEGLRLADVPEGDYELLCLPLRIAGVEALPARAVLYPLKENQPKYKKTTCR